MNAQLHNHVWAGRTTGNPTWITPRRIVEALGPFDLDPATPESGMPWPTATSMLKPSDDGLAQSWAKDFVWLNPPYGRECGDFMRKMARHGHGIALVAARTDTRWFDEAVWRNNTTTALLFMSGRVRFCDAEGVEGGTAGFGTVLVAYGELARERLVDATTRGAIAGRLIVLDEAQEAYWQLGRKAA